MPKYEFNNLKNALEKEKFVCEDMGLIICACKSVNSFPSLNVYF
jgi:hypothetical protein